MPDDVTITFTQEELDAFWAFQSAIYDSLGSASDDVIEACAESADSRASKGAADSFFTKLIDA